MAAVSEEGPWLMLPQARNKVPISSEVTNDGTVYEFHRPIKRLTLDGSGCGGGTESPGTTSSTINRENSTKEMGVLVYTVNSRGHVVPLESPSRVYPSIHMTGEP